MIVACDGSPPSPEAADRLRDAAPVVGAERHLAAVRPPKWARRLPMGDLPAALRLDAQNPVFVLSGSIA